MLSCITGLQRSGKSYYCVTMIIQYLRKTNRDIYTNLPLYPDALCNHSSGGKLKNPAVYENHLKRIHMFVSYRKRKRLELKELLKVSPDYHNIHKRTREQFLNQDKVKTFWQHTRANSIMFLDELYQFFSATDIFDQSTKELRKELLAYTRQHGHFKDDLFLVSHTENDLDCHIRRGIQQQYYVSNSKYRNMFEGCKMLRGIKYPWQFFIIEAKLNGEKEISDRYIINPIKDVFKCYNSHSSAETLNKKTASYDAVNTDYGVDHKSNISNYIRNVSPLLSFILCIGVGGFIVFYYMYTSLFKKVDFNYQAKPPASAIVKDEKKEVKKINKEEYLKPLFITPEVVVYEGNLKLTKGMKIAGYEIKKIMSDYVMLDNGSLLSLSGIMSRPVNNSN